MNALTRSLILRNKKAGSSHRGFTLVEMMVVIAIMAAMMAVVLWDYKASLHKEATEGAAQQLRLSIREAQIWANSSRQFPLNITQFDPGYEERYDHGFGIYLSMTNPEYVTLYGGNDTKDAEYSNSGYQRVKELKLPGNAKIIGLCRTDDEDGSDCFSVGNISNYVTLFYRRPSAVPIINGDSDGDSSYKHAKIQVGIDGEPAHDWYVEIHQSGRIEITKP